MVIRIFLILFLGIPYLVFSDENELSPSDLNSLIYLAQSSFNQHTNQGLSVQVDLAKKLLLENPNLISNENRRKLFLAQDSNAVAAILCTVASRYLYILAMRTIYKDQLESIVPFPSFPHYYLLMVDIGAVTTDSSGKLFAWLKDGITSTGPFLPGENWKHVIQYRSGNFPTDGSLLNWMKKTGQPVLFIRDSANARSGSHTFLAIKNGAI